MAHPMTFFVSMTILLTSLGSWAATQNPGEINSSDLKVTVMAEPNSERVLYRQNISIAVEGKTLAGKKGLCILTQQLATKMKFDLIEVAAKIKSGDLSLNCDIDQNSIARSVSFNASSDTKLKN
jgi:hypothetical protein